MSVIRSIPPLEALRDEWARLEPAGGSPLLEHDWVTSCVHAFHAGEELRIVTCRQQGELVAVAPLVRRQAPGGARLEIAGMAALHEPGGLLAAHDDAMRELVRELVRLREPVVLERLERGASLSTLLRSRLRPAAVIIRRDTRPSLVVRLQGTWTDYERGLTTRLTKNLPRLRQRAGRVVGPVRSEVLAPTPSELGPLLDGVYAVEASGWKGRSGSAMRDRAALRGFFERYAGLAAAKGRLRLARLWFGDRVAAVELAVVAYRRWWQLKIGYEDSLGEFYPGLQLTHETVRHAVEQQLDAYEFLGSAAEWERRWNPEERRHEVAVIYPASARGLTALAADAARGGAGAIVGRLRRFAERAS